MNKNEVEIYEFEMHSMNFFCLHTESKYDDVIFALGPGARFSKVPIINGPGKRSPFALKIEISIVLHLTR